MPEKKAKRYYKYRKPKSMTIFLPEGGEDIDKSISEHRMQCTHCGNFVPVEWFTFTDTVYVKSYKGRPVDPYDSKFSYTPQITHCPWCGKRISKMPVKVRIH